MVPTDGGDADELFDSSACRSPSERALTLGLNDRAQPWVAAGVTLIGPVVQEYDEHKLVFFLDPVQGRLLRVEYHREAAAVGRDLTGQGGPDLDPRAPGVLSVDTEGDVPRLANEVADRLDALLGINRPRG